jgi:hypothetical protein
MLAEPSDSLVISERDCCIPLCLKKGQPCGWDLCIPEQCCPTTTEHKLDNSSAENRLVFHCVDA